MKTVISGFTFLLLLFVSSNVNAQIQGHVTDENGEPLPFATVYLTGTTNGTTTNVEGYYELRMTEGVHQVSYRYVGYDEITLDLEYQGVVVEKDIQLFPSTFEIDEVVITADAEDPAYRVIREAQKKRKFYQTQIESYSVDTYVKGNTKMADVPEKVFGMEVGNMEGVLDSNRQGIVYLSESQSKLYIEHPDKVREVMISSKVSGDDRGFGFNRASDMDFDLYQNQITFQRAMVSPIADNAIAYYRYKLIAAKIDDKGRLVNKIQLLPKQEEHPCYQGYIYIIEDLWNIKEADLLLTKKSLGIPVMDTLEIKQIHLPVNDKNEWKIFNQSIRFKFGFFGVKFEGKFTVIFSNYDSDPGFEEDFFGKEVLYIEPTANQKDTAFWAAARPIPLTDEEAKDYIKKDSLQVLWKSPAYRDSIDRRNNRFKPLKLITGYTYQKSLKRFSVNYDSPISSVGFNTVQGLNADLRFDVTQSFEDSTTYKRSNYRISPTLNYSFAEEKFRASANLFYVFNRVNNEQIYLAGGEKVQSFNAGTSLTPFENTYHTLFRRKNYMKLFNRKYLQLGYGRTLIPALFGIVRIGLEDRSPLSNRSDYSFKFEDSREFTSNDPLNPNLEDTGFTPHKIFRFSTDWYIRIKPRYVTYPGRRWFEDTGWPSVRLTHRMLRSAKNSEFNSDLLTISIADSYVSAGVWGELKYRVSGGKFFGVEDLPFMDRKFFDGNSLGYASSQVNSGGYRLLDFYEFHTDDAYIELSAEHNFKGYILGKLPLLRKTGFEVLAGAKFLSEPTLGNYTEVNVGIGNIGFSLLRFLRVDYVWGWQNGQLKDSRFVLGINL